MNRRFAWDSMPMAFNGVAVFFKLKPLLQAVAPAAILAPLQQRRDC